MEAMRAKACANIVPSDMIYECIVRCAGSAVFGVKVNFAISATLVATAKTVCNACAVRLQCSVGWRTAKYAVLDYRNVLITKWWMTDET